MNSIQSNQPEQRNQVRDQSMCQLRNLEMHLALQSHPLDLARASRVTTLDLTDTEVKETDQETKVKIIKHHSLAAWLICKRKELCI